MYVVRTLRPEVCLLTLVPTAGHAHIILLMSAQLRISLRFCHEMHLLVHQLNAPHSLTGYALILKTVAHITRSSNDGSSIFHQLELLLSPLRSINSADVILPPSYM